MNSRIESVKVSEEVRKRLSVSKANFDATHGAVTEETMKKNTFQSKTFWTAVVCGAVGLYNSVQPFLPPDFVAHYGMAITAALCLAARAVGKDGLTIKKAE